MRCARRCAVTSRVRRCRARLPRALRRRIGAVDKTPRRRGLRAAALALRLPLRRRETGHAIPSGRRGRCVILLDFAPAFDSASLRAGRAPLHRLRVAPRRRAIGLLSHSRAATVGAPRTPWPRRVVAVQAVPHQPRHQPAQRQVRILVRQQHLQLLQPMPALRVDRRFQLPAPAPERSHPVARLRPLRVHLGQHLLQFARALAGRLLDQLLPRRGVQHRPGYRCRVALPGAHRCRRGRFPWCAVIPRRTAQATGSVTALASVATLEQVPQLGRVAQVQRAVLQPAETCAPRWFGRTAASP